VGHWDGQNKNLGFAEVTTFWQRPVRDNMCQENISSHTWRGHMAGQTHPHNCLAYHKNHRVTNPGYGSYIDSG
jgi:hypothetical protein